MTGLVSVCILNGCATLKDSLILGAGLGVVAGGIAGSQSEGDKSENAIKGAVIGGVALGLTSYLIHNAIESRDSRVRRDTLMNLEHYDVMGLGDLDSSKQSERSGKCYTTKEVDGQLVSIPCYLVNDSLEQSK